MAIEAVNSETSYPRVDAPVSSFSLLLRTASYLWAEYRMGTVL